ncbi:AMP-binding protein [Nocardioides sp. NPDC051685]|uniref:AMP-binding protein n=1 Tax=Nocardioides sp. NPDC051685 TaxID=3364334 RepID=UPI0037B6D4DA
MDTIPKAAAWAAERYGSAPALVSDSESLDFNAYVEQARRVASALIAVGVQKGDKVAIQAPNSVRFALCALGIQLAGACLVPINTRFKPREVAQVLADCDARLLFTVDDFLGVSYAEGLLKLHAEDPEALHVVPPIVLLDDQRPDFDEFLAGTAAHAAWESRVASIEPDDIATVLFTSGTTGRPKGATLTHGALVRSYWVWSGLTGLREGDRFLVSNPFFHAFGLMVGLLSAMMQGAVVYPMAVFNAEKALELIERERITYYPGPPTVFREMLNSPELATRDLSSLRTCVTGATSIPPTLIDELFDVLGYDEVFIPYGFTEGTGIATITRSGDPRDVIKTTAGRALPGVELEVRRADGSRADVNEVGEIVLRGFNVMPGYLDPGTGQTRHEDSERWLASGDLGRLDERGNLAVVGRIKDLVIVGGFNVYPAEVEACLTAHPAVDAASVVGLPDERLGEVPFAFVVPATPEDVDEAELHAWCRERLANFKVPRQFCIVSRLPMNASGKVLKKELQNQASRWGETGQVTESR